MLVSNRSRRTLVLLLTFGSFLLAGLVLAVSYSAQGEEGAANGQNGHDGPRRTDCGLINIDMAVYDTQENGKVDDAIFWAHDGQVPIDNVTISVYRDGRLVGQVNTTEPEKKGDGRDGKEALPEPNGFLQDLSNGTYYWNATYNNTPLTDDGYFTIAKDREAMGVVFVGQFDMNESFDDLLVLMFDNSTDETPYDDAYIQIYDGSDTLVGEGTSEWFSPIANANHFGIFHQFGFETGWYDFELYYNDTMGQLLQNGTFHACGANESDSDEWFDSYEVSLVDADGDGLEDTALVNFTADTDAVNATIMVYLFIYDPVNDTSNSAVGQYFIENGTLELLNLSVSAAFNGTYLIWAAILDSNGTGEDFFQDFWYYLSRAQPDIYFDGWYYEDVDWDEDGHNETKMVWYNLTNTLEDAVEVHLTVDIFDSTNDKHSIWGNDRWLNLSGNSTATFQFNWSAYYTDSFDFVFDLKGDMDNLLDRFTIHDNYLDANMSRPSFWFYWKNEWREDTDGENGTDTWYLEGEIGTLFDQPTNASLSLVILGPDSERQVYDWGFNFTIDNNQDKYFDFNWTSSNWGNYTVLITLENETETFHTQVHWFCFGPNCQEPSPVWFNWKDTWVEKGASKEDPSTWYVEGEVATSFDEGFDGIVNITIYGPDNMSLMAEEWSDEFSISNEDTHYFSWNWTSYDEGWYYVEVTIENETDTYHYQQHWFCFGGDCDTGERSAVYFETKNWWTEDWNDDGFNETLLFEMNLATDRDENMTGYLQVEIYGIWNETYGRLLNQTYFYKVNQSSYRYVELNWSANLSQQYEVYIYIWNLNWTEQYHYQWHYIDLENPEYWFDWWYFKDVDYDEDGYNESKEIYFDLSSRYNESRELQVSYTVISNLSGYLGTYNFYYDINGTENESFMLNYTAEMTDYYDFYFNLYDDQSHWQHAFQIYGNYLELPPTPIFIDSKEVWTQDDNGDDYDEVVYFNITLASMSNMTERGWLVIEVMRYGNVIDQVNWSVELNDTTTLDINWNWTAMFTADYNFYVTLYNQTNETVYHFQSHYFHLEVYYYWFESHDYEDHKDTKQVRFDIGSLYEYPTTVGVEIYVYYENWTFIEYYNLSYNVTGDGDDEFYFNWTASEQGYYNFELYLLDEQYRIEQDYFTIYHNYLEGPSNFTVSHYDWWHEDWNEDDYEEVKYVEFDIDSLFNDTRNITVYVEIYDSEDDLIDNWSRTFNVTGDEQDDFEFYWAANHTDSYSFYFYLYDEQDNEYDAFSIEDNYLEVHEARDEYWFADGDYDDDGDTKQVWFDIDSLYNDTTAWVAVEVYYENGTLADASNNSYAVNGDDPDEFYFNWTASESGNYTFEFYLYDDEGNFWDNVSIEDNYLSVEALEAWFEDWDYYDDNLTKQVWFDPDTNSKDPVRLEVTVYIYNSSDEVYNETFFVTVTGEQYDRFWFNWTAKVKDYYDFELILRDGEGNYQDELSIEDNWLGEAQDYWFADDDYEDDGDTKRVWFDIDSTYEDTTAWVAVDIYYENGTLADSFNNSYAVNADDEDEFHFNWTAEQTGYYTFEFYLFDGAGERWDNLSIEDNYLLVELSNQDPTAAFSYTPRIVYENFTVTFDASTSTDPDGTIVLYEWDFDDDGIFELNSTGATRTHQFTTADSYLVTLRVTDDEGANDSTDQTIVVAPLPANIPPEATIDSITPNPADERVAVTFNGSGKDFDATGSVVDYQWFIDGTLVSGSAQFSRSDLTVGDHDVSFRVKDNEGAWSVNDTATVTIEDATGPELGLLAEPDFTAQKIMVYVSSNEELSSLVVVLDNGSGRTTSTISMSTSDNRYFTGSYGSIEAGNYTFTATGTDLFDNEATATTTAVIKTVVTTKDEALVVDNTALTDTRLEIFTKNNTSGSVSVSKTSAPAPVPDEGAEVGLEELGIYVSIDIDDSILEELDYVNITVYYDEADIPAGKREEGLVLYHYVEADDEWVEADPTGVNTVENYVWGHVSTFSIFAIFGSNVAPTASAGSDIETQVNQEVTFTGSGSDLDGNVVKYEWDFDGDGTYDHTDIASGSATYTYPTKGTYTAKLRVTDDKGATGFDTITVTVGEQTGDDDDGGGFLPGFELVGLLVVMALMGLLHLIRRR